MDRHGLKEYANQVYKATAGLMQLVPEDKLSWKPSETNNWMTLGQLLHHLPESTGMCMKMFIEDAWPEFSEDEMMASAEKMATAKSVQEALDQLEKDRKLMVELLDGLSDEDYTSRMVAAPWCSTPFPLWAQLLGMVEHQINHKMMLFTYLKLLDIPVHTGHLYGV